MGSGVGATRGGNAAKAALAAATPAPGASVGLSTDAAVPAPNAAVTPEPATAVSETVPPPYTGNFARLDSLADEEVFFGSAADRWAGSLSPAEDKAFERYVNASGLINSVARNNPAAIERYRQEYGTKFDQRLAQAKAAVPLLESALSRSTLPDNVYLFRGLGGRTAQGLLDRFMTGQLHEGDVIREKGFMSTSRSHNIAQEFTGDTRGVINGQNVSNVIAMIRAPKGAQGAGIGVLGHHAEDEGEVLFARNTRLVIRNARVAGGTLMIYTDLVQ